MAHVGFGSVAWVDQHFARKRQDLAPDGLHELLEVPTWQIGPSDRPGEHHVADEGDVPSMLDEHNVTRRMSRREPHLKGALTEGELIPLGKGLIGRRRYLERDAVSSSLGGAVVVKDLIVGVQVDWRTRLSLRQCEPINVIKVGVGQQNSLDRRIAFPYGFKEGRSTGSRVDDDPLPRLVTGGQVSILGEGTAGEHLDVQCSRGSGPK